VDPHPSDEEEMRANAWDGAIDPRGAEHRTGAEHGATAVEFTLTLSVLIILLFGIIQFGIAYNRYQGLHAGAREGGRIAALSQSTIAQIQSSVRAATDVIDTSDARYVDPCPADPNTMSAQQFCINVLTRDNPGATPVLLTTPGYSPSMQPCNLAPGKSAIVNIHYRMPITIPLWAVTVITSKGVAEFSCQS
jgi:hypothetical protein